MFAQGLVQRVDVPPRRREAVYVGVDCDAASPVVVVDVVVCCCWENRVDGDDDDDDNDDCGVCDCERRRRTLFAVRSRTGQSRGFVEFFEYFCSPAAQEEDDPGTRGRQHGKKKKKDQAFDVGDDDDDAGDDDTDKKRLRRKIEKSLSTSFFRFFRKK